MRIMDEFHLSNFGLNHIEPRRFVTSEWRCERIYAGWRIFWAVFHICWIIMSLVHSKDVISPPSLGVALWFIYLSNWTYLLLTLTTLLDAAILIHVRTKRQDLLKGFSSQLPWYMKVSWMLNNIVTEGSFHVSAFYWMFIFKEHSFTLLRFVIHGVNSIYVLVNLLLSAMPVRLCHVIYPIIYGVIYAVFSVVYHILGGTNMKGEPFIYKVLDWSKWRQTLPFFCLSTFVVLPFLYMFIYFIHFARVYIYTKQQKSKDNSEYLKPASKRPRKEQVCNDVTASQKMMEQGNICEH